MFKSIETIEGKVFDEQTAVRGAISLRRICHILLIIINV